MRALFSLLTLVALVAASPERAYAQETAVRFPITAVGDTSFTFQVGTQRWVRVGLRGFVVDPRRQDELVARFRVVSIANGLARGVVTGQTTSLSALHSALIDVPARPWYKQRAVWIGTLLGAAAGFFIGGA